LFDHDDPKSFPAWQEWADFALFPQSPEGAQQQERLEAERACQP
jgi:hypothetical protein|tara:strand:+ start:35331 stop:35462 length:132 start_codon:yes stop_codon:yes gene_type:complete